MGTKHHSYDQISDQKKRRRVGFFQHDAEVEANACIKIYLVSSKEEVESPGSFLLEPVDLSHFFEEDGKIYGYQGLKINIWISSISFHSYADISFESTSNGGKGITDLKSSLQNIFADNLVEKKDDFLQMFSSECNYVKKIVSGVEVFQKCAYNSFRGTAKSNVEPADTEVYRVGGDTVGHLYCRLVPLVLLLIDGSNPIDVTDPNWQIYVLARKCQKDGRVVLIGFAAVYHFHRYPSGIRMRLGQILVIPPYQRKGYGRNLLEVINNAAIAENVYDLTVEEPVDSLQHVRTCIDVLRLFDFEPIRHELKLAVARFENENLSKKSQPFRGRPPASITEDVRKSFKINKKQFMQCWEILIYLSLDPVEKYMENYQAVITKRLEADVIGKESEGTGKRLLDVPTEFDQEMSFSMFKTEGSEARILDKDANKDDIEKQLKQLVEMRMKEIKAVAGKISVHHS